MRMTCLAAALFAVSLTGAPANAQDGPKGIAFATAPEQSNGFCVGGNPEKTLACARQKCAEGGAAPEDCARVAWCFPMGWSVEVSILHKEGIHWSEYTCGWDSRESALAAAKLRCDTTLREFIQDCAVGRLWDKDGREIAAE